MEIPRRRFEVTLKLSGDDWKSIIHEMDFLSRELEEHGPVCNSVSGGYSSGHIVEVKERPEQTHDLYHEQVQAWLKEKREQDKDSAKAALEAAGAAVSGEPR